MSVPEPYYSEAVKLGQDAKKKEEMDSDDDDDDEKKMDTKP